jgi:D-3-phosphoglycerate dehydrogenase
VGPGAAAAEHPLLALPNVVATYHTAGVTHEARRNNATLAATQIAQLLTTGQRPERLVNRDVWPRASARLAALAIPRDAG